MLGYGGTPVAANLLAEGHGLPGREVALAWMPFVVLEDKNRQNESAAVYGASRSSRP